MVDQSIIESFLAERRLALAGASSTANKFGNAVYKELSSKDYKLFLVHRSAKEINGVTCYGSLFELPDDVGGLVNVVPPAQTEKLVQEAHKVGIKKVWMQQGSDFSSGYRVLQGAWVGCYSWRMYTDVFPAPWFAQVSPLAMGSSG